MWKKGKRSKIKILSFIYLFEICRATGNINTISFKREFEYRKTKISNLDGFKIYPGILLSQGCEMVQSIVQKRDNAYSRCYPFGNALSEFQNEIFWSTYNTFQIKMTSSQYLLYADLLNFNANLFHHHSKYDELAKSGELLEEEGVAAIWPPAPPRKYYSGSKIRLQTIDFKSLTEEEITKCNKKIYVDTDENAEAYYEYLKNNR